MPASLTLPSPLLSLVVTLLLGAAPAHSQPISADEAEMLLQRVQSHYASADGLRATFTQRTRSPFTENAVSFDGTLLLQGTKYRVETGQQTLVTDGQTTWIYTPTTNQVIINRYENDETIITPDEIFTDYLSQYRLVEARPVEAGDAATVALTLTADEASAFYTEATVHIRRTDAMLTRVELEDRNGATTIFQLHDVQRNPSISEGAFTYTPPPDAEVVDLRS